MLDDTARDCERPSRFLPTLWRFGTERLVRLAKPPVIPVSTAALRPFADMLGRRVARFGWTVERTLVKQLVARYRDLPEDRRQDMPALLNALVSTASGAAWVSIHNGGGVGIGYSLHAGQVLVADGSPEMAARIERVLTNDPGIGVARHVDAGYREAIDFARKTAIKIPTPAENVDGEKS